MSTAVDNHRVATSPSSVLGRLIVHHPVTAFLVMAYGLGWSTMIAAVSLGLPMLPSSSLGAVFGLALPAFLVTVATSGKPGVQDLLRRALGWRVGVGWYLLASLGLLLATLLFASVFLGPEPVEALGRKWPLFFTMFLPSILVPLLMIHLFEETGWTGFVQDTLQDRHGPLLASILTASAFALFHFPLGFLEAPRITFTVVGFALLLLAIQATLGLFFRTVIAWLYNSTGRSVIIVALFHSAFNSAGTGADYATRFIEEIVAGPAALLIPIGVIVLMAVVITISTRGRLAYEPSEPRRTQAVDVQAQREA